MQLEQLARTILFGDRWEDKLLFDDRFEDSSLKPALVELPRFPGRPIRLSRIGKSEFPRADQLTQDSARGQLLHFFANHELLAMELMALMLLRFPDAPKSFRAGIARTIHEEQNHLKLYVERMRELGVDFGDLPISDYFWNAMKGMTTPLEFVIQMSLTLEQANLDFSLFYQKAVAQVGDVKTASILEQVYREEIGHVKHGVTWFNRWRLDAEQNSNLREDDWDAYLRLLPPPMTPRRAKGVIFCSEPRREAGLSERFIRELEVYSGSKGRPPVFWNFNPLCDAEIARGKPGFTPAEPVRRLGLDLETLPMYLAREQDVVLVQELPNSEWLKKIQDSGFSIPEFRKLGRIGENPREEKIGGIEPWGWSPEPFERFKFWKERLVPLDGANGAWSKQILSQKNFTATQIGSIFSKKWSTEFLSKWLQDHPEDEKVFGSRDRVGKIFSDWSEARQKIHSSLIQGESLIAKAPFGTSGTQNKRVLEEKEMDGVLGGWIRNTIESQGSIVLEPWLNKEADLSIQFEIGPSQIRILGIRHYVNGSRLEYRGTALDPKLSTLSSEALQYLHSSVAPLERWRKMIQKLGTTIRDLGYQGPAGVDALLWRELDGSLRLKPLVELNPRWTMGRVALELESHVLPGTPAAWMFLPVKELEMRGLPSSLNEAARILSERHFHKFQISGGKLRLAEGIIFTTDPSRAREVITLLGVGTEVLANPSLRFL